MQMKLLASAWQNYANSMLRPDASIQQQRDAERAFYAGASAFLASAQGAPIDYKSEAIQAMVDEIYRSLLQSTTNIPVLVAQQIALHYGVDTVVIQAWREMDGMNFTTTFGRDRGHKLLAAYWGELTAQAIGTDASQAKYFEDFRERTEGSYEQER